MEGPLFEWEKTTLSNLLMVTQCALIQKGEMDDYKWLPEAAGVYSVKPAYGVLSAAETPHLQEENRRIFKQVVPSKVAGMAWKVGLKRLPTLDNLSKR